jgi:hypothetical protein
MKFRVKYDLYQGIETENTCSYLENNDFRSSQTKMAEILRNKIKFVQERENNSRLVSRPPERGIIMYIIGYVHQCTLMFTLFTRFGIIMYIIG